MTTEIPRGARPRQIDKQALRRAVAESNARMGIVRDPAMTAEMVQEMMIDLGIRPEDNAFSRDLIRIRYEDEV